MALYFNFFNNQYSTNNFQFSILRGLIFCGIADKCTTAENLAPAATESPERSRAKGRA
jgi:hypothetical protein